MMRLQQAFDFIRARIPAARLVGVATAGAAAIEIQRVHTDTRTLQPGDLFVALRGARYDAHDFLPQARAQGAVAVVAERGLEAAGLPGIAVPDGTAALGALAAGWRAQFTLPLIAVTGSNGKTTVTQMLACILAAYVDEVAGEAAFATRGNLNNAIGVPQTLLRLTAAHRVGVVELGMNHPGEIAYLAELVRPTVALVNNAQREHLEFMYTVEAVARENGAVLAALPESGVAVFPAQDAYTPLWRSLAAGRRCLTFGAAGADFTCTRATWELADAPGPPGAQQAAWSVHMRTPAGPLACRLHIAGRHNVTNALAAAACAFAAGVPRDAIAQGLAAFRPVAGRSRAFGLQLGGRAITVVDDSYNANPDSVRAAIAVLAELPAPQLLVLGDMGEVGSQGPQFHAEAGAQARAAGISALYALGELAAHAVRAFDPEGRGAGRHFDTMVALQEAACAALPELGSVLVKGSRFMKMEQVVQALGACRALGVDSENGPQRGQFLPDSQPHSETMGQEDGKKWAAAAHSQPTIPKSDRLLEAHPEAAAPTPAAAAASTPSPSPSPAAGAAGAVC